MLSKIKNLEEWTLGRWEVQVDQGELDVGQEKTKVEWILGRYKSWKSEIQAREKILE